MKSFLRKTEPKQKMEVNKIYNEDCLNTLKQMKDDSIDIVITSPPYNMNMRIKYGKYCSRQVSKEISTKYHEFPDNLKVDDYNKLHTTILKELLRVSPLIFYNIQIVTGSKRSLFKMIGEFHEQLKDIIIWDKGHGQPAMMKQVMNRRTELILVFDKHNAISRQFHQATFNRGTMDDIWLIKRERSKDNNHKAIFPQELIHKILHNFSKENDIVYDPFIGTGTTAVVAQKLNRRFIGSEINSQYTQTANQRLMDCEGLYGL